MQKHDFDELLAEYRQADIPALPGSFSANVLREIRLRSGAATRDSGWLSALITCLRPGMAAAGLAIAISVGVLLPGIARGNEHSMAVAGLGLNVFSPSASNLPSTLLTKLR